MKEIYSTAYKVYQDNTFCGIYGWICNITGKWYVGESKDVLRRTKSYVINPACLKKQILIKNAIEKYGIQNFTCYKLEECSFDMLREREAYWGNKLNSLAPNGYNLKLGGGKKVSVSDITKQKISIANKGRKRTKAMKETISFATKKAMTPEVCTKIAAKARRPKTEEQINKIRISMIGKNTGPRTEEVKKKISIATKINHYIKYLERNAPWFLETSNI